MNNTLPPKAKTILEQVIRLLQPAAIRAGGPVLVNIKRADGDTQPDNKQAVFIQHFQKGMNNLFLQTMEKTDDKNTEPTKKTGNTPEEIAERISKYSLMDTELLEAQLVVERLCASLQQEYQYDVDCLGMRLEKYFGLTFERDKNPMQARHLTMVFRQCCDALTPSKHSGDVAMENWGKVLKQVYPQLLQHLNQTLIKQHILPRLDLDDINHRYQKKDQEKAREMRRNLVAEITGKPQNDDTEISDAELMQSIRAMFTDAAAQKPELNKHIIRGTENGPTVTKEEILETLQLITRSPVINPETGYRELGGDEKTLAEKILASTDMQSKALDTQTQNAISLLSMMFDRLQQEEQIAEPIKPLINELQVPILKLAVNNEKFFSNADNPAQELLNEIAKAGTHWTPKQNISKDPFYRKISSIVDEINVSVDSGEDNEFIFDEKLLTLKDFLAKEERRAAIIEERIIQAESVKARTEAARAAAERIIETKITKYNAQPDTAKFLQDYWKQVLFFYINRDDDYDSEEKTQAISLIDTLLSSTPETLDTNLDDVFAQLVNHLHNMGLDISDQPQTLSAIRDEINILQQKVRYDIKIAKAKEEEAAARAAAEQKAAEEEAARLKAAAEKAAAEQAAAVAEAARLKAAAEKAAAEEAAAKQAAAKMQEEAEKAAAEQAAARLKAAAEKAAAEQAAAKAAAEKLKAAAEQAAIEKAANEKAAAEKAAARQRAAEKAAADKLAAEQAAYEALQQENTVLAATVSEDDGKSAAEEDIFDQQVSKLRAESWFKLSAENGEKVKVKLAAIIKHNGNYIFVNREGVKIITTQKSGVAAMLRSGELAIVDDAVFFDRALESVIHSLRR